MTSRGCSDAGSQYLCALKTMKGVTYGTSVPIKGVTEVSRLCELR